MRRNFFLVVPLHVFVSKGAISRFGERIRDGRYSLVSFLFAVLLTVVPQIKIKSNYFIVRLKVDQRAGQLSLPHLGITITEKIELKHKTDEQISPVSSLEP